MCPPVPPAAMTNDGAAIGGRFSQIPSAANHMADPDLDLTVPRRVHVIGVGGAAMSAIARILAALGHDVSGSDANTTPYLAGLADEGVTIHIGYDAGNVAGVDVVAVQSALRPDHPEVTAARDAGITMITRP